MSILILTVFFRTPMHSFRSVAGLARSTSPLRWQLQITGLHSSKPSWTLRPSTTSMVLTSSESTLHKFVLYPLIIIHSWEYPGVNGDDQCNTNSPNDTANFLSFLQELRQDPTGSQLTLTAATGITPFAGPDGTPSSDVSGFADVLDHIGTS